MSNTVPSLTPEAIADTRTLALDLESVMPWDVAVAIAAADAAALHELGQAAIPGLIAAADDGESMTSDAILRGLRDGV
jgi:hypothetical protein